MTVPMAALLRGSAPFQVAGEGREPGQVAARPGQAGNKTKAHRISTGREDDGDGALRSGPALGACASPAAGSGVARAAAATAMVLRFIRLPSSPESTSSSAPGPITKSISRVKTGLSVAAGITPIGAAK